MKIPLFMKKWFRPLAGEMKLYLVSRPGTVNNKYGVKQPVKPGGGPKSTKAAWVLPLTALVVNSAYPDMG
jgi:hypothetical protein